MLIQSYINFTVQWLTVWLRCMQHQLRTYPCRLNLAPRSAPKFSHTLQLQLKQIILALINLSANSDWLYTDELTGIDIQEDKYVKKSQDRDTYRQAVCHLLWHLQLVQQRNSLIHRQGLKSRVSPTREAAEECMWRKKQVTTCI